MIFEAVLILVGFFAADDGAAERFGFFAVEARCRVWQSGHHLLFSYSSRQLAVGAVLAGAEAELCILLRIVETSVGTEQPFCRFVDTQIQHVVAVAITKASKTVVVALHKLLISAQLHVAYVTDKVGIKCVEFGGCTGRR